MKRHILVFSLLAAAFAVGPLSTATAKQPAEKQPVKEAVAAKDASEPALISRAGHKRHEAFKKLAQKGGFDVMFLGDSITQGWEQKGKAAWNEKIAPLNAANFGISGDRTGHVLWRLKNGELEGKLDPKVIVIMIGTNDTGHTRGKVDPEVTAKGIKAIIGELQARLPKAKILLLAIFPRSADKKDILRTKNEATNAIIAQYADNKRVFFKNINSIFLTGDSVLKKEVMPDLLHLNEASYQKWADAIVPEIKTLLGK